MNSAVYLFVGHYGSGKTEVAINFASMLHRRTGRKTALIDMDIVNPFFRSADAKAFLEEQGIRVETPLYANTNVDIPALTGAMGAIIEDESYDVIVDVGGDDLGAKAVGRYSDEILGRQYYQYFVVNKRRPFTSTPEDACKIFDEVTAETKIRTHGIINNCNLLDDTVPDLIFEGAEFAAEFGRLRNVPLVYNAVPESLVPEVISAKNPLVPEESIIPITRRVTRLF